MDHTSAKRLLPLGYLAPDIVEAVVSGLQPADLSVGDLSNGYKIPMCWTEQRAKYEFPAAV